MLCLQLIVVVGMKTVTLEVITEPVVCPGQEVILTCTVMAKPAAQLTLVWKHVQNGFSANTMYSSTQQQLGPHGTLGDFNTTAVLITSNSSTAIVSNATLKSVSFSNNNSTISCYSPPEGYEQTTNIIVAGTCVFLNVIKTF